MVNDKNESANILNNDLLLISKWAYNWKMLFNPDPSKPAQKIHPTLSLNNIQVERTSHHKHLGILPDQKLNCKQLIDTAILKINKGISVGKKLRHSLPRKSVMIIYKAFLRSLIDYGNIIYDQPQSDCFCEKLEPVQYKAALAITGAMQGTSRDKIYQELGLEPQAKKIV